VPSSWRRAMLRGGAWTVKRIQLVLFVKVALKSLIILGIGYN
jgi:hypothetical protein